MSLFNTFSLQTICVPKACGRWVEETHAGSINVWVTIILGIIGSAGYRCYLDTGQQRRWHTPNCLSSVHDKLTTVTTLLLLKVFITHKTCIVRVGYNEALNQTEDSLYVVRWMKQNIFYPWLSLVVYIWNTYISSYFRFVWKIISYNTGFYTSFCGLLLIHCRPFLLSSSTVVTPVINWHYLIHTVFCRQSTVLQ